ncbi:hypothetical protein PRVXT_002791 [Proteinivorax tanatarense]|uniref:Uncharacterized protein n=1 Tax=Proteinivorax tanatarense TaxID=1260629 RepID=A0AAU7VL15_9FIRM
MNSIIIDFLILAMGFFVGLFLILLAVEFNGKLRVTAAYLGGVVFVGVGFFSVFSGMSQSLFSYISISYILVGITAVLINTITLAKLKQRVET